MALLGRESLVDARTADVEALFREARRRRRRRRLLMLVVAVAVATAVFIIVTSGVPPTDPATRAARGPHGSIPPSVRQQRSYPQVKSAALDGKYALSAPVFPTDADGFLSVGGYSDVGSEAAAYWSERTWDGGRHWVATSTSPTDDRAILSLHMVFADARDGWAYGFNERIHNLWSTQDGGAAWQAEFPGFDIASVAVANRSTWIIASPVRCARRPVCPSTVYETSGPGRPIVPLTRQPRLIARSDRLSGVVHPTPLIGWTLLSGEHGRVAFEATADAGRHWTERALPCSGSHDELNTDLAASGAASLWTTCERPSGSISDAGGLTVVYRSTNGGRTWERATPPGANPPDSLYNSGDLTVVSPTTAWAQVPQAAGDVLLRTTDGGERWTDVLNGAGPRRPLGFDGLTTSSPLDAYLSVVAYTPTSAVRPEVASTTNGGRTWTFTGLPAPPNVPRARS